MRERVDLDQLRALQQQATAGPIRFIPENGCLVDERGDIVADVQPLDEQDCILTAQDGEYLAALWTAAPALLDECAEARQEVARLRAENARLRAADRAAKLSRGVPGCCAPKESPRG